MNMLLTTSRTFYIPISRLTRGLKEAVASAYLCMRAIDEIEDHEQLPQAVKVQLLQGVGRMLRSPERIAELAEMFAPHRSELPPVTLRLEDWVKLCPQAIAPRVVERTAVMAEGMAGWVEKEWRIRTKDDLDDYTYCVAGAVGEMLSDLWLWHDGTVTDYDKAVAFGRGLQAVNILRNHIEDRVRGVNFFPDRWGPEDMLTYARGNLEKADSYILDLRPGPALDFCSIPLALAHGTLDAIAQGKKKLSRLDVIRIVSRVAGTSQGM
ncbi:phytoene/squalene synthase family protein [Paenibacillus xerothermodurans]|uniref:Phytoene/squalene synthase family protein n=2 Tax=Paenibacillus xerothermodurans TaxID=1977292 RepID=A0A2W1NNJ4_PAEXE|nr:phytoene/squalene synthase family protein [Paenibacillus xerothermodurans]PZE20493.1 phytoene/squalene synthase family protein [Paenibacillus xerothermodurans]